MQQSRAVLSAPHSIYSAGVDWLTATKQRTREAESFQELGRKLLCDVESQGNDVRLSKRMGYHGKQSGGVYFGVRADTYLLMLSGSDADEYWSHVVPICDNISRLDLQVTVELETANPTFVRSNYMRARRGQTGRGRKRAVALIQHSTNGDSLYLGQRISDVYARHYDKGRESKCAPAGKLLRYEVETKREVARSLATSLKSSPQPRADAAGYVVKTFAASRVLVPPLEIGSLRNARVGQASNDARRLLYMASVVRPMLEGLTRRGKIIEALRALGLLDKVSVHPEHFLIEGEDSTNG